MDRFLQCFLEILLGNFKDFFSWNVFCFKLRVNGHMDELVIRYL